MSFNPHKYQQMSHTTLNRKKKINNNNIKKTLPNLKCSELLKLKKFNSSTNEFNFLYIVNVHILCSSEESHLGLRVHRGLNIVWIFNRQIHL